MLGKELVLEFSSTEYQDLDIKMREFFKPQEETKAAKNIIDSLLNKTKIVNTLKTNEEKLQKLKTEINKLKEKNKKTASEESNEEETTKRETTPGELKEIESEQKKIDVLKREIESEQEKINALKKEKEGISKTLEEYRENFPNNEQDQIENIKEILNEITDFPDVLDADLNMRLEYLIRDKIHLNKFSKFALEKFKEGKQNIVIRCKTHLTVGCEKAAFETGIPVFQELKSVVYKIVYEENGHEVTKYIAFHMRGDEDLKIQEVDKVIYSLIPQGCSAKCTAADLKDLDEELCTGRVNPFSLLYCKEKNGKDITQIFSDTLFNNLQETFKDHDASFINNFYTNLGSNFIRFGIKFEDLESIVSLCGKKSSGICQEKDVYRKSLLPRYVFTLGNTGSVFNKMVIDTLETHAKNEFKSRFIRIINNNTTSNKTNVVEKDLIMSQNLSFYLEEIKESLRRKLADIDSFCENLVDQNSKTQKVLIIGNNASIAINLSILQSQNQDNDRNDIKSILEKIKAKGVMIIEMPELIKEIIRQQIKGDNTTKPRIILICGHGFKNAMDEFNPYEGMEVEFLETDTINAATYELITEDDYDPKRNNQVVDTIMNNIRNEIDKLKGCHDAKQNPRNGGNKKPNQPDNATSATAAEASSNTATEAGSESDHLPDTQKQKVLAILGISELCRVVGKRIPLTKEETLINPFRALERIVTETLYKEELETQKKKQETRTQNDRMINDRMINADDRPSPDTKTSGCGRLFINEHTVSV